MYPKDGENFVQMLVRGEAKMEDNLDVVDEWHERMGVGRSLEDVLGLTGPDEYQIFLFEPRRAFETAMARVSKEMNSKDPSQRLASSKSSEATHHIS